MIGKFVSALRLWLLPKLVLPSLILILLLGARAFAQAPPAPQTPASAATSPASAAQQPPPPQPAAAQPASGQEPAEEVSISRRRKPKDYKNWQYNVGAGINLDSGTTKDFVRGGSIAGTAGVARNANKYLGLRAEFIFADLPLRQSALGLAQATSASNYLFAITLDPIVNIPVTKLWGGYILFGPGFYHRYGTLNSDTAVPGSACNSFFEWWGACPNVSIPISGDFLKSNLSEFGYNFAGGITRKMPSGVEIYMEYRLTHGSRNGITTDVRPVTIGVRW